MAVFHNYHMVATTPKGEVLLDTQTRALGMNSAYLRALDEARVRLTVLVQDEDSGEFQVYTRETADTGE